MVLIRNKAAARGLAGRTFDDMNPSSTRCIERLYPSSLESGTCGERSPSCFDHENEVKIYKYAGTPRQLTVGEYVVLTTGGVIGFLLV